jgi:hypothetical protein
LQTLVVAVVAVGTLHHLAVLVVLELLLRVTYPLRKKHQVETLLFLLAVIFITHLHHQEPSIQRLLLLLKHQVEL